MCSPISKNGKTKEPGKLRVLAVLAAILSVNAFILWKANFLSTAPLTMPLIGITSFGAIISVLLIGSVGEWLVHRYIMHRTSRFKLFQAIYDLHHKGHHFIHFTPEQYVHEGEINYIPVYPPQPTQLCQTAKSRFLSMAAQGFFYLTVATIFTFLPTYFITKNITFTTVFVLGGLLECYLFVRVHDLVHYPGHSFLERFRTFRFLDHHHYIHHLDTKANTNFLLPLGDVLFGTYRSTITSKEAERWPSFEEAKRNLIKKPQTLTT